MLKHRIWYSALITSASDHYYSESISSEPTVTCYSIGGGYPFVWEHIISNGQYTGIKTLLDSIANSNTVFVVFARR